MQGKTINGFELKSLLGCGGMAEVWLTENAIGKKAAVKLLLPKFCNDEAIVARFQNEAEVMVELDHPNIRQVLDYGYIDNRPCIVMEYLEGDDLKAMMKSGKCFTDAELRKWWNQIADALNYTHAKGIVHRDIKPSNIFLNNKGNIKLLDFGIAKIKESISMTQTGAMMGTLLYMSPEQVEDSKHIGPQSDSYSLAVTFVHLLTGKAPYDSSTLSDFKIREIIVYKFLDLSGITAEWQRFLIPYLEKDPKKRPALRPFDMVTYTSSTSPLDHDDATISESIITSHHDEPSSMVRHSQPDPLSEPKDKPNSKKGIWVALCIAVVVAIVMILFMANKDESEPNLEEQTEVVEEKVEDPMLALKEEFDEWD